jgi:ABC-2 type transport system permease protein
VKHAGTIASREVQSLFVSPVAYVVLALWVVLAGSFFLTSVLGFQSELVQAQRMQAFDFLREMNLNDGLIMPFLGTMWIVLIFAIPGVTMGLFANERANGTEELLLTSPVTIWEIVLGKFMAGAFFVLLLTLLVGVFCGLLFVYGDPEPGKTVSGLLGLFLVSLSYVAVGSFASSVTKNQLVAFVLALVILLVLLVLPVIGELGTAGPLGGASWVSGLLGYLSPGLHFEQMAKGLVTTTDLVYFVFITGTFLLLAKFSVESARWR